MESTAVGTATPQGAQKTRRRPPRRGRYVSKACVECKRRKTKCSGQMPCENCSLESTVCHYDAGPARVRRRPQDTGSRRDISTASGESYTVATMTEIFPGTTDHRHPAAEPITLPTFPAQSNEGSITGARHAAAGTRTTEPSFHCWPNADVSTWNVQKKLLEVQRMRAMVRQYIVKVNPWIPCINEWQLNRSIDALLAGRGQADDQRQMAAIIDLIIALIEIMTSETAETDQSTVVGWSEFQRAENVLSYMAWNGVSNLRSIQCLILKTMYLIYADKNALAYDTVASMARICFQLGLHDEKNWDRCSPTKVNLRQGILWTVFCLDRHVAEACSLPYLIRHSALKVALPAHIDLQNTLEALPSNGPNCRRYHIYFYCQRAVLFSEAWDCLLTCDANDSEKKLLAVSLDRRIQSLRREIPSDLQWRSHALVSSMHFDAGQRFQIRQSLLLHLLLNALRLLLRRPWIHSAEGADPAMVTDTVKIAVDTIDSLQTYYQSTLPDPIQRHGSVRFLMQALHLLEVILLQNSEAKTSTAQHALQGFKNGVSMLEGFATHLTLAKSALGEIKEASRRIPTVLEQDLLTRSLDDCLQWLDFLDMGGPDDGCDLNGVLLDPPPVDTLAGSDAWPLQYIHTDSWLM